MNIEDTFGLGAADTSSLPLHEKIARRAFSLRASDRSFDLHKATEKAMREADTKDIALYVTSLSHLTNLVRKSTLSMR
jgi:hypothetical protein